MNLVDNAWIPVSGMDGKSRLVSLMDVFKEGETIADLSANPCQRIALMRLLICIAQAALDGPADEEDWRQCRSQLPAAAADYLNRWRHRFNLYGDHAFLQVDGLDIPDNSFIKTPSTLNAASLHGGTGLSGIWDHTASSLYGNRDDATLPLYLLCYVNFSCSGKVGKAQWRGALFNGATSAGPSHNYLHSYLLGDNILDTIQYSLVPKDAVTRDVVMGNEKHFGVPVWERMPQSPHDSDAMNNASKTYLGRLVPLSRLVKFIVSSSGEATCTIGPPPDALKMQRLPYIREPAATVVFRKDKDEKSYLLARAGRHIWRDLESVLATGRMGGTLSLTSFLQSYVYPQLISHFRLWIGGSVRGSNEGKYDDVIEWSTDLNSGCFVDRQLTAYRNGIEKADRGKQTLFAAMLKYCKPKPDAPGKDKRQIPFATAESVFWNSLDRHFRVLVNVLEKQTVEASANWELQIREAMHTAYSQTCPHETPRQIEAYAQGWQILKAWKDKKEQD
jgi:CRISPR system Cascade subunit CasA